MVSGFVTSPHDHQVRWPCSSRRSRTWWSWGEVTRSEEHTSELQSLRHLVCRLLLEKKKQPEAIVCRRDRPIAKRMKEKISAVCEVPEEGIVSAVEAEVRYEITLLLDSEWLDEFVDP